MKFGEKNPYSRIPCKVCFSPSVGVFYDEGGNVYYCTKHFAIRSKKEEEEYMKQPYIQALLKEQENQQSLF